MGCNEIARTLGRSTSSVSNVAREIGHDFGQINATRAHEARAAYGAERRALIAAKAAAKAEELIDDFDAEQPVNVPGSGLVQSKLDAAGQRNRAQAAQLLVRTALDIDRHDRRDDEGLAAVDRWLRDVVGGS
jgi:hypothetical protein